MIKKRILPMLLAAAFIFCMLPTGSFAASGGVYKAGTPKELSAALEAASGGGTIRLTADIDYDTGIVVAGKTIIFDLNGHTLNVSSSTGHGLEVDSGGIVDMKGRGAFNVSSSADLNNPTQFAHGVYTFRGGKATVTSASTTTMLGGSAACANGEGSCVTVKGDVKSPDAGAAAYDRGHVIVDGNVIAGSSEVSHPAIYAFGNGRDGSLVEVAGNVTATGSDGASGVRADIGGTIRVKGNITGYSNGVIGEGGTVWVGGSVTAKHWGVNVDTDGCSDVTIDGTLTAPFCIEMGDTISESRGTIGTGDYKGYLVYTDGESTVRVKIKSESVSPATSPAGPGVHDAGTPEELSAALNAAADGEFIRLTADIDYDTGIVINGKKITFDLNGHTLGVASSTGHGLEVGDGGAVDTKGNGAFNVTSSKDLILSPTEGVVYYGVYAYNGGYAKVTSATKTGLTGFGVCANGKGSCIEVKGDVKGSDSGAVTYNGGHVIVDGNAEGDHIATYAYGDGSLIEVAGNVTMAGSDGATGVNADTGGTVRVLGNVYSNSYGVSCRGGTAWVDGSVTAGSSGISNSIGATVWDGGNVTIGGTLTSTGMYIYIQLISEKTVADGVPGTGDDAGYLVYTDGSNTVRLKAKTAVVSPASMLAAGAGSGGTGMSVRPISDTQIEMEKEVIDIVQRGGCSYVTCEYWFHNTGKSVNMLAGFPTQYWSGNDESGSYYSMAKLNWVRTFADGKRVRVSVKKGLKPVGNNEDGLYSPQWYTWRMHFAAGERIKVVNKYWIYNSATGADVDTLYYILRSGAVWIDPKGKVTVRMHQEDFELENTTFTGMQPTYIKENGTIVWESENNEPDKEIGVDGVIPYTQSGVNPFNGDDKGFLPYRAMTLRMLRNFYAGHYNGTTWWGNRMLRRFGGTQSSQLYYCMGVSYYKLGYTEKALGMFSRIRENDVLYRMMSAYYKALICKEAGDDAGYRSNLQSIEQYLSGIPEDKMSWGAHWLRSRLDDITKQQSQ